MVSIDVLADGLTRLTENEINLNLSDQATLRWVKEDVNHAAEIALGLLGDTNFEVALGGELKEIETYLYGSSATSS